MYCLCVAAIQCDYRSQYDACGSPCPETCAGPSQCENMPCLEGCFCPSGYVRSGWFSSVPPGCIRSGWFLSVCPGCVRSDGFFSVCSGYVRSDWFFSVCPGYVRSDSFSSISLAMSDQHHFLPSLWQITYESFCFFGKYHFQDGSYLTSFLGY